MNVSAIDISAGGMRAQRLRMDLISNNMANVNTTSARTEVVTQPDGQTYVRHIPYRRKMAVFMQGMDGDKTFGVSTPMVVEDMSPFRAEEQPGHPHAVPLDSGEKDKGVVYYPNIDPVVEMVDMIAASRAYEANLTAVDTYKAMANASLRILA